MSKISWRLTHWKIRTSFRKFKGEIVLLLVMSNFEVAPHRYFHRASQVDPEDDVISFLHGCFYAQRGNFEKGNWVPLSPASLHLALSLPILSPCISLPVSLFILLPQLQANSSTAWNPIRSAWSTPLHMERFCCLGVTQRGFSSSRALTSS